MDVLHRAKARLDTLGLYARPVRIARVDLHNSSFEFAEFIAVKTGLRWRVSNIEAKILNINPTAKIPLTFFTAQGTLLDSAMFKVAGKAKRLAQPMAYEADLELRNFDLRQANPMLINLVPVTFTAGYMDLFSEVKSEDGHMAGYIKPFFKKVQIVDNSEHFRGVKHFAVEIVAALANAILRKSDDKSVGTRIAFHQDGKDLKVDTSQALSKAIQHGFSKPLPPSIEDSLNLQ